METPVDKIKKLLKFIPARDIPYATKFVEERNFEALRDLVRSCIQILKRKKDESLSTQIDNLRELKAEIDCYLLLLGTEDEDFVESDFWGVL